MKNNELIALVIIVFIVMVGVYAIVSVIYQPKQSANIPTPLVTITPTIVASENTNSATQTPIMVTTQSPILTSTTSPLVGPLISICSSQLADLAQMGTQGSPYPLIHTYIGKYDPKSDLNYQVNYETKYVQYWMNPTTGSFNPTLVRSLLSLTSRDTVLQNYYVEVNFFDSNYKLLSADNGYAWRGVQPKQIVVAEVLAPENAACYMVTKVCTVSSSDGVFHCSIFDVVPSSG